MPKINTNQLAAECAEVSDRLNNLLTAIQLRAGLLMESTTDRNVRNGLQQITDTVRECAVLSARLRGLSEHAS